MMIHTQVINNVPMFIRMKEVKMNDYLNRMLSGMFTSLIELTDDITRVDTLLEETTDQPISPRKITVVAIHAGEEVRASDSGKQWKLLIKHVQQRLKRQVQERNELLKRQSVLRATVGGGVDLQRA